MTGRARFGLPKRYRILHSAAFAEVMRRGRRRQDRWFTVFAVASERDHVRLGLTVPRKVARQAVRRNRLKRHIRESARCRQLELAGIDVVVLAHPAAAIAAAPVLRASLEQHWISIIEKCKRCC